MTSLEAKNAYLLLTPRLREILTLVADGHSVKEIAATLDLSPKTVESHLAKLRAELDIYPIALLARFAVKAGAVAD